MLALPNAEDKSYHTMPEQETDEATPYIVDIPYSARYIPQQSPSVLNFLTRLNGAKGRPVDQPYAYCDLGCGKGLTGNTLAAANPDSQFYGIDLNPEHIDYANALANRAGLKNSHFLKGSFSDFSENDLPQFDYITLHGVYSWVSPDVQAEVRNFLQMFLKPGGIVYVSYNTLPGWAPFLPIREIMKTFTEDMELGPLERADEAVKILQMLVEKKVPYTNASSNVRKEIRRISREGRRQLTHEFLNVYWQPRFFSEVAAEMATIGLSFCCLAKLQLSSSKQEILDQLSDFLSAQQSPETYEAAKSMVLNERFRRDIYVNAERLLGFDAFENLSPVVIGNARVQRLHRKVKTSGMFAGATDVVNALYDGHHTLSELAALPELKDYSRDDIFDAVCHLINKGTMRPFARPAYELGAGAPPRGVRLSNQFNQVVLEENLSPGGTGDVRLASPVTGDGLEIDPASRLLLLAVVDVGVEGAVARAFEILGESNIRFRVDGKRVTEPEAQRSALEDSFALFQDKFIPALLRLGILEEAV